MFLFIILMNKNIINTLPNKNILVNIIKGRNNMDIYENFERVYMKKSKVIEMVCAMLSSISSRNDLFTTVEKSYGKNNLKILLNKYSDLFKVLESLGAEGYEILEFLLINNEFDNISKYETQVKALEEVEFFYYFFGGYIPKESINKALEKEEKLKEFYYEFNFCCSSFEVLKYLFYDKENFLTMLFNCIKEFDTKELDEVMENMNFLYEDLFNTISEYLKDSSPLGASQKLMGKTFKNRGPYENFIFVPTYFLPGKAVRFIGNDQILLYKILENGEETQNKLRIQQCLKVISDPTRFDILQLLCENEPMFGKEIAEHMKLSPPTISHHLDQLRDIGFVNEERVKNSKYFSANKDSLNQFIKIFHKTLNKK